MTRSFRRLLSGCARLLPLIGILVVIAGFAFRANPVLVVTVAALATGLAAHKSIVEVVAAFGKAFVDSRSVAIVWLALPVIGMLERYGLKEQARAVISRLAMATTGRLLLAYLALRQITAALGLTSLGGHAQMVRPIVAPMSEAAAETRFGRITQQTRNRIRAFAAATDNVGVFFGEDIFIAIGSILLIRSFLDENGIHVEATSLAEWAVPTAICAFLVHGTRLLLLDRALTRHGARDAPNGDAA